MSNKHKRIVVEDESTVFRVREFKDDYRTPQEFSDEAVDFSIEELQLVSRFEDISRKYYRLCERKLQEQESKQ